MSDTVPLMGASAGGSYGAAPESGEGVTSANRGRSTASTWSRPVIVLGALSLALAGTLAITVASEGNVFAYLGSGQKTRKSQVDYAPTYESADSSDSDANASSSDSDESGVSASASASASAALGAESDFYGNTCSLPQPEPMPAGCFVQEIRPMVSCEYSAIAQSKIPNLPTCNGVDVPQNTPKNNDHGFDWTWSIKVDVPYKVWEDNACDQGYDYPCQTGSKKHCVKIKWVGKRCTSTPTYGTCHGSKRIGCFKDRVKTIDESHSLKKLEIKCQRQGFLVPGKTCTECLPGFVKDGDACVSVVEKEAAKLKNKAMAICEAIPKAIDTAGDVIMATLFPSDATALGNMLAVRAFPNSKSRRLFTASLDYLLVTAHITSALFGPNPRLFANTSHESYEHYERLTLLLLQSGRVRVRRRRRVFLVQLGLGENRVSGQETN